MVCSFRIFHQFGKIFYFNRNSSNIAIIGIESPNLTEICETMDGLHLPGSENPLNVKPTRIDNCSVICVEGFPENTEQVELESVFGQFGQIRNISIFYKKNYSIISFENAQSAIKSVSATPDLFPTGWGSIRIRIKGAGTPLP